VAYNGSPEAARALAQSIHLAKALDAELCAITVQQDLPPYTAYAAAADSSLSRALIEDQQAHGGRLHSEATHIPGCNGAATCPTVFDQPGRRGTRRLSISGEIKTDARAKDRASAPLRYTPAQRLETCFIAGCLTFWSRFENCQHLRRDRLSGC